MAVKKEKKGFCIFLFFCLLIYQLIMAIGLSPLYDNCYLDFNNDLSYEPVVIGKEWLNGYVPYRDLFGIRGIFIYFLYALGWLTGKRTGIFIIYTAAAYIGLSCLSKILYHLFEKSESAGVLSCVYTLFMFFPMLGICGTGLQADMLIFPAVMGLLYLGQKMSSRETQNMTMLWGTAGALIAVIFWMNTVVFLMGMGIIVSMLIQLYRNPEKDKKVPVLGIVVFFIVSGICIGYLAYEHALSDCAEGMIEFNFWNLTRGMESWNQIVRKGLKCSPLLLLIVTCYAIMRKKTADSQLKAVCSTFLGYSLPAFVILMLGEGVWHRYIWSALAIPLEAGILWRLFESRKKNIIMTGLILFGLALFFIPAKAYIHYYIEKTIEISYEDEYNEIRKWTQSLEEEQEDILAVDISPRYYLITDLRPRHKYFVKQTDWYEFKKDIGLTVNEFILEDDSPWILVTGRGAIYHEVGNYHWETLWQYEEPVAVYRWMDTSEGECYLDGE